MPRFHNDLLKLSPVWLLVALLAFLLGLPLSAQTLYDNGPVNGHTDAWLISLGYAVSDSFTISGVGGSATITGFSFYAWMYPGDTLASVELSITSVPFGGMTYFQGVVSNFTASNCFSNQGGWNVCQDTASFDGPELRNGAYWLTLQNATAQNGDVAFWDENSGIGCQSPGCPSSATDNNYPGSIPGETFSVLGTVSGSGSVPEPNSLLLFTGGVFALALLRRKLC